MFTYDDAVRYAKEVIAERGEDFVYNPFGQNSCAYVPRSDERFPAERSKHVAEGSAVTGCLVGEIFKRAGLLTDEIAKAAMSVRSLVGSGYLPDHLVDNSEDRLIEFLSILQGSQDDGEPWGNAFSVAYESTK